MKAYKRWIKRITLMKPNELKAANSAFVMVFVLMAAYFILRPIRDAMASDWSDSEVSFLWNIQFFISMAVVGLYGLGVSRLRFRYLVPMVYGFFALTFLLFYAATPWFDDPRLIEKSFYVWVTTFSLLNLSVFWGFMSNTFNKEQGQRLFPFISAGASAGALLGPAIPVLFSGSLGLNNLMLLAALVLVVVIPIALYLNHLKHTELGNHKDMAVQPTPKGALGGAWWQGFRDTMKNPYLLGIAAFILLYVFISSFVYFQQKNILAGFTRVERAQILGGIDWVVNALTFLFAFVITGRMVKRLGMSVTLASVPLLLVLGMAILMVAPMITVLLALQVARRVGNYSVTRPAREMLFTQVTHEERFKAKPVIDVVVYRGGDAVSASLFALMTDGLGLGLAAVSAVGAGIAALWATVGIKLGKRYQQRTPQAKTLPTEVVAEEQHA